MPQAVIPAIVKGTFVVSKAIATGSFLGTLGNFAATTLLSTLTNKLFGPKVPSGAGLSGIQVTTRSALEYRKIVYGRSLVSGPIIYNNLSGSNGEYLWYVVALCDGESDAIEEIWIDGRKVEDSEINWTPGTGGADGTGNRNVNGGDFLVNSTAALRASWYLGETDQPASGDMVSEFTDWTTNHRLRGATYVVVDCFYSEAVQDAWQTGTPRQIRALVRGRKIYDPRLDSTNGGSGSHRYTDSSTWAWSDNPALCVADYLTQIMGVDPATKIDWDSIASSADDCDVSVTIPSGSETRFTCNGALSLGTPHKTNLNALLSSCDGKLSYFSGRWKLRASVWEASSTSLTENDFADRLSIRGSAPRRERFNTVRGFFIDPERNHEAVEFNHVSSSSYVTRDNSETIERDLELPMTNTETMAQRVAYRLLEQGDNQLVVEATLKPIGANIAIGDVVDLTVPSFNWTNKTFRVIEWARNDNGTFPVVLREDDSTDYDDPMSGEYTTGVRDTVTVPASVVASPTNLTATGVFGGNRVEWDNPAERLFDQIEVYSSFDNSWANASLIARVKGDTYTEILSPSERRWYWVRAARDGVQSLRLPNSDTSTIDATTRSDVSLSSDFPADITESDIQLGTSDNAQVGIRVDSDGDVYIRNGVGGSYTSEFTWIGNSTNTQYEVMLVDDSDSDGVPLTTGIEDSWQEISSDREYVWTATQASEGGTYLGRIRFRRITDYAVLEELAININLVKDVA